MTVHPPPIVLAPEDHAVLGEAQFGTPGLVAIESIGPCTRVRSEPDERCARGIADPKPQALERKVRPGA